MCSHVFPVFYPNISNFCFGQVCEYNLNECNICRLNVNDGTVRLERRTNKNTDNERNKLVNLKSHTDQGSNQL